MKNKRGITLVALVITIIVMLIYSPLLTLSGIDFIKYDDIFASGVPANYTKYVL